jgi:predicted RNA-binding protein with PIN domain
MLTGARSTYECYTLIKQTARGVRILTVYKPSLKITTVKTTDLAAALTLTATGACTVSSVTVTNKLNGKNVRVARYQVALGKKGTCTLTYSNEGSDKYAAFSMVKTFKITKTGK